MFRHGHFFFNSIFHEILVLLHSDYREEQNAPSECLIL